MGRYTHVQMQNLKSAVWQNNDQKQLGEKGFYFHFLQSSG